MSGPKAFRIVTRAEIMAICRRSLARLDAAIEDWISRGQRNGTIDKADIDKVTARRDALRGLLSADRFVELQKQIPAEICASASVIAVCACAAGERGDQMRRLKAKAIVVLIMRRSRGLLPSRAK
jgi:hypothetical protein